MKIATLAFTLITSTMFGQSNPVIVELFTSQGCSSCPAADKNLAELIEEAEKNGQPVFGLSYHVDYWNYIGWKDPYSNPKYTDRQRKYSQIMNAGSIYTPQMIVNGEVEFVGSTMNESREALARALIKKTEYPILLGVIQHKAKKILVPYSLEKTPANLTINAAIAEQQVENNVTRGENAGRKLAHRNVVRYFVSNKASKEGVIEIDLPSSLTASSLIVFIQDEKWHVKGATATKLN